MESASAIPEPDKPAPSGTLDRWLADVRADSARLDRRRQQWILQQQEESATFVGHLATLAERAAKVIIQTGTARHAATLVATGRDVLILRDRARWIFVPIGAALTVRAVGDPRPVTDAASPRLDITLAESLLELTAERERVVITLQSGERLAGRVTSVGSDVATVLSTDGEAAEQVAVQLKAVDSVVVS